MHAVEFDKLAAIALGKLPVRICRSSANREFFHDLICDPKAEYRQIQRNKNERDKYGDKNQDDRLDPAQQRGGLDVDVFIVEVGHVVQHFRQANRSVLRRASFPAQDPENARVFSRLSDSDFPSRT